jgi:hypothetical protein
MLASLFSKVTSSLGKTYAYAGLLPAGVFLLFFALYYTSTTTFFETAQSLLASADTWKSVASIGAFWIFLGFILYALRSPVFSLFQVFPGGWLGRKLIFRRVARRERLRRARVEIERRETALHWLRNLDLNRSEIGDFPHWLLPPDPTLGLNRSRLGREALINVDRTAGDVLNLSVFHSDAIVDGIFLLFLLARGRRDEIIERAINSEIQAWRLAAQTGQAQAILEFVEHDLRRKFTRAFSNSRRFGEGAYIFPTELGNRLSALDDYAQARYGIDTATIWDRLWWVLPKEAKSEVSDARLSLETLVNLALAMLIAGLFLLLIEFKSCGLSFGLQGSSCNGIRFAGFVIGAFVLARFAYSGATFAMEALAIRTTTLIDMYRLVMVKQLGFSVKTVGDEVKLYRSLKGFFGQATELDQTRELAEGQKAQQKVDKSKDDAEDSKKEQSKSKEEEAGDEKEEKEDEEEQQQEDTEKKENGSSI